MNNQFELPQDYDVRRLIADARCVGGWRKN
jgi:hypothetical protein